MGRNLPESRLGKIQWFETRTPVWGAEADPTAIGLTSAQVAQITSLTVAARNAYTAAENARAASKVATESFHQAVDAMHAYGADLISAIKSYAETTNNPAVYDMAMVSPPDPRGTANPPAQPYDGRSELLNDGSVRIWWKGSGPTGTHYLVRRKLDGENAFTLIADVGEKQFIDQTVPAGIAWVRYSVTAKRGEVQSPPGEQIVVQFGASDHSGQELSIAA